MNKPELDNKPFELKLSEDADGFVKRNDVLTYCGSKNLRVLSLPKQHPWYMVVLFYLSLGFYDRRGYTYKVKLIENE